MHEYPLTGRPDTDRCLRLANKAHQYYFSGVLANKKQFIDVSIEFYSAIKDKFIEKNQGSNIYQALNNLFKDNQRKKKFFQIEFGGICEGLGKGKDIHIPSRLKVLQAHPELVNEKTKFILDHTARFMEVILPYACSVKEEVEHNKKFDYEDLAKTKMVFFSHDDETKTGDQYLSTFYACAWRAQKSLNGARYVKEHAQSLNCYYAIKNDSVISQFYHENGPDYYSTLIFTRMANEQFLKYLSSKKRLYEDRQKWQKGNNDPKISIPLRIEALEKAGALNPLIASEANLVNARGNSIAHNGIPGFFSSCYDCLELLNYYAKYCI